MDEVAKELKCRQRILSIYNKSREDFDTKEDWDDYLEIIEDSDVQQTEARIHDYERSNRANIIANQARKAEAERVARGGAPAVPTPQADNPQGFVPTSLASTALSRQPVPVGAVTQDADGSLKRSPHVHRLAMGSQQEQAQAAAAGWSPDMPRLRAMQEAFGSLLLQL